MKKLLSIMVCGATLYPMSCKRKRSEDNGSLYPTKIQRTVESEHADEERFAINRSAIMKKWSNGEHEEASYLIVQAIKAGFELSCDEQSELLVSLSVKGRLTPSEGELLFWLRNHLRTFEETV